MFAKILHRPVLAIVISILIVLLGVLSIGARPVSQFPEIAPPQVQVAVAYPGASADVLIQSTLIPLERAINGVPGMRYMISDATSAGEATIQVIFDLDTDPNQALINVKTRIDQVMNQLPKLVQLEGVILMRVMPSMLMYVNVYSLAEDADEKFLFNFANVNVLPELMRVKGIGQARILGSRQYAMRIWLNPDRMRAYNISAQDVQDAISEQSVIGTPGRVGQATGKTAQSLEYVLVYEGRFNTPEQYEDIILRATPDGHILHLKDVAKVELGSEFFDIYSNLDGHPSAAIVLKQTLGSNAQEVIENVKATLEGIKASTFPPGMDYAISYDVSRFVDASIEQVTHTLAEAFVLVALVVFVFLGDWRSTLIPTLAVPVSLVGAFIFMGVMDISINLITLFALVLAIGIVVDDAIVVIENVERIMAEDHLPPLEATEKAMDQITGAVVAITVVLAAVFIPSALQGGASGEIYKQFAITIAMAMGFSAFLALGFTPALCATFLKQHAPPGERKENRFVRGFNRLYDRVSHTYVGHIGSAVRHAPRWMLVFVVLAVLCGVLLVRLPGSFVPEEDQGYAMAIVQLPPGATLQRTQQVFAQVRGTMEKLDGFESMMQIAGFSFVGQGENVGMAFIKLKDWADRDVTVNQFIQNANGALYGIRDASIFVVNLPTIQGLGQFGGFDMYLQDRAGLGRQALAQAQGTLLAAAAQEPDVLSGVRPNTLANAPQLELKVDRAQAETMGLSTGDVYNAIQLMLAPVYVNDYFSEGRIKRVIMRADAPYRTGQDSLSLFYSPSTMETINGTAAMIPLSNVVRAQWTMSAPSLTRYNGYSAVNINGSPAPGRSSGEAMQAMEQIVADQLPAGIGYDWTGLSYQEIIAGNTATLLLVLSVLVVFLCLAALYESWSIPVSVLLVVPLGILGAVVFTMMRGLSNDIFFKIGLVTVIGLAAKNAILIVEFAVLERAAGKTLREAVVEAARLRFRPILMTSMAFILGVTPLAISTGAGANARHSIGTGVIGGMLFATFLGLLLIPVFFVAVRRMLGDKMDEPAKPRRLPTPPV